MKKKHFNINIYKNQNVSLYPFIYYLFFIIYILSILYVLYFIYVFNYTLAIPVNRSCM